MLMSNKKMVCEPVNGQVSCKQDPGNLVRSRPRGVYQRKSGRWYSEIRNPMTKLRFSVGTYDIAEEVLEAVSRKRSEFASMVEGKKNCELSDVTSEKKRNEDTTGLAIRSRPRGAYHRKSGRWFARIQNPITKLRVSVGTYETVEEVLEAVNKKRHDFASMVDVEKNHKQLNVVSEKKSCKDQIGLGLKPQAIVYEAGRPKVEVADRDECGKSNMIVDDIQVPSSSFASNEEFDTGIINAYGQLVGEFSRLDDELWLCGSLDEGDDDNHLSGSYGRLSKIDASISA